MGCTDGLFHDGAGGSGASTAFSYTATAALAISFIVGKVYARFHIPKALLPPPKEWAIEFIGMATEAGLSTTAYLEAFTVLERFWTTHQLGDME